MKSFLVVVEWYDILSYANEDRNSVPVGCLNLTAGFLFKRFSIDGMKHIRVISTAPVIINSDYSDTDDFIDIPVGCIKKLTKIKKYEIGTSAEEKYSNIRKQLNGCISKKK